METAIIAALVAGAVTLVGLLVNLHIARQTRKATADQLRLGIALKAGEETVSELKAYARQAELMRIACWEIWAKAHSASMGRRPVENMKELAQLGESFNEKYSQFFSSWAEVKSEVPPWYVEVLRVLRHEAKHRSHSILDRLYELQSLLQKNQITQNRARKHTEDILREVESLLQLLDKVFSIVQNVKTEVIVDLLAQPEPNNAIHSDGNSDALHSRR